MTIHPNRTRNKTLLQRITGPLIVLVAICATPLVSAAENAAAAAGQPGDWPQYRGPNRNGISEETLKNWRWGTNVPKVLWQASVGKGFSSFAAVGPRVYTMGNAEETDTVFCLEADTGKVVWRHSYACELQPLSYEGGPSSTPAVEGGRVFTLSKSGDLFCLDAETGREIWKRKFELWPYQEREWRATWRYAGSPLAMGPHLILSIGQAGMALNKNTGETVWKSAAAHPGYSSPVPFPGPKGQALAFFSGHGVHGVEALSGREFWRLPWETLWDLNGADPIISGGKMFVSSGNGVGCALFDLSATPPRELWRNKNLMNLMNSSVLWKGLLFGFNDTDLACVDWETGEEKWRTRDVRKGSLILAGGKLLLLSETGKLVVAEPSGENYQPLAEAQVLTGRCWTSPVLSRGRIYIRNAAGEAACLDVR